MPRVAMKSTMPSWFTSGRSTRRSMSQATPIMITTVTASATAKGIFSMSRTSDSAAKSTMAPCAKLKTPEALKMSTSPSATREYSTPDMSPPSTTSIHCGSRVSAAKSGATAPTARIAKSAPVIHFCWKMFIGRGSVSASRRGRRR